MDPKPIEKGELPKEVAAKVVADMIRLQAEGREGFANPSQLARTLGVAQPSARAWIVGRAQPSYEIAKRFAEKSGISYPELSGGDVASMKWLALRELARDKFDVAAAFTVLDSAKFDETVGKPTWGDYYKFTKEALQGAEEIAREPEPPPTKKRKARE